MLLKTVEIEGKTYAEVDGDKPVYVSDGKEIAFDAPHASETIKRLNGEAKGHREAKETAEKALKAFEGIEDPKAAKDALQKIKSLGDKELMDAGKVEEIKEATRKAIEEQYAPYKEKAETLESQLRQEKIGGSFARSQFIAEKLAVPVPMVEATFGSNFTIEDGKVVAKDANGNAIYSKSKPGDLAGFDEALEIIVEGSPYRDSIMKGRGHNGSGAPGGGGGNAASKTITRENFNALSQGERAVTIREGVKVVDQ